MYHQRRRPVKEVVHPISVGAKTYYIIVRIKTEIYKYSRLLPPILHYDPSSCGFVQSEWEFCFVRRYAPAAPTLTTGGRYKAGQRPSRLPGFGVRRPYPTGEGEANARTGDAAGEGGCRFQALLSLAARASGVTRRNAYIESPHRECPYASGVPDLLVL